jgi:hypothetical protein
MSQLLIGVLDPEMISHGGLTTKKVETMSDPLRLLDPGPVRRSYRLIHILTPRFLISPALPEVQHLHLRNLENRIPFFILLFLVTRFPGGSANGVLMTHRSVFGVTSHLVT